MLSGVSIGKKSVFYKKPLAMLAGLRYKGGVLRMMRQTVLQNKTP
jgi:hypothetical protein